MDMLTRMHCPKTIRCALAELPTGSEAYNIAYENAMDRVVNGQSRDHAKLAIEALSWIVRAKRPLTATELQHALAVEANTSALDEENLTDIDDVVAFCAGLVTIDKESGIIRLAHYTAQEYFERTWEQWFP